MTELEIKNIIPYLHTELKCGVLDFNSDYVGKQYDKVVGIHQWDKTGKLWCVLLEGGSRPAPNRIKPILRSLEDMDKYIFKVPNGAMLSALHFMNPQDSFDDIDFRKHSLRYEIDQIRKKDISFEKLQYLFDNQFDVFELIPKGLAIDINSI